MPNAPPTSYKIAQYHQWHVGGQLDLAPPFQRKPVWSIRNKAYLIDTILNNLPIPEVYIQVKTDKEGKIKYTVVDGQQRIRAILEFIDGEYSLPEDESPTHADKTFAELSDGEKEEFWAYPLVTRELITSNITEVQNIFRRLNRYVVPLNDQELRNATYSGHFISLVNKIAEDDEFWAENKIVTPSDIKRMKDAEYISELFIGMMHGIQKKDQDQIDNYYKLYDEKFLNREEIRRDFEAIERIIKSIFGESLGKSRWHGKPDFYSLFLAVHDLSKVYYIPPERYEEIRNCFENFGSEIDRTFLVEDKGTLQGSQIRDYTEYIERQTTNKQARQRRFEILKDLLIPFFLVAKDSKRSFNEDERRIAWANSKDKKCAICGIIITEYSEYEFNHKTPKGGKTELKNAQITHKTCNAKKSDATL